MKKILINLVLLFSAIGLFAQEGSLGLFAGGAYYIGELNPRSIMYMPSPAFGILYRHNFNKRWTLRFEGNYTTLKGDDANSDNTYQQQRGYSFSNKTWDIGASIELNFFDFETEDIYEDYFSPYITTGLLLSIVPDAETPFEVAVPIGLGFKYALTEKITAGLEWNYRWTNSDQIDGLESDDFLNVSKQMSYNPDTDWYSFFGVIVTFQIFKEDIACPAFN